MMMRSKKRNQRVFPLQTQGRLRQESPAANHDNEEECAERMNRKRFTRQEEENEFQPTKDTYACLLYQSLGYLGVKPKKEFKGQRKQRAVFNSICSKQDSKA